MKSIDEKVFDVYREYILNERKFDLGSGHLGHGISVYNRAKEVHGDYEKIAHIDDKRKVTWYIKNPTKEVRDYVEKIVKGKNPSVSTSQRDKKVFREGIDESTMSKENKTKLDREKLNEASLIDFKEVDDSKKKLVQDILGKKDAEKQTYFDGIHGTIVSFNSIIGDKIRVNKKSLQRILKDKNVRWVDISAIGF